MAKFLGIDGGGSKTSCLIGDEHSVLGRATVGGSNIVRLGESLAKEALASGIQQACTAAKISPSHIARTCIGVAGAGRADVGNVVRRMITEIVSGEVEVVGDMVVAMEAAFGPGPGVIVVAGTGSIAYGRNSKGETARSGGLGFAISDEGSGHWIGRAAVAAVLRNRNESAGKGGRLFESILKAWHLESGEQLVLAANAAPTPDFAGLFPVVLSASESGDTVAFNVLTQAGTELAVLAKVVISRLFQGDEAVPMAMSGGVFANSASVREVFYNRSQSDFPAIVLNQTVVEPVRGALELARRKAR